MPHLCYEKKLWDSGIKFVAGLDEVGRGALAGPVYASAVVFPSDIGNRYAKSGIKIDDSKKLSAKRREQAHMWIVQNAIAISTCAVDAENIDKDGIVNATNEAFVKCIHELRNNSAFTPHHLLIDAVRISGLEKHTSIAMQSVRQTSIIKGDSISLSIAAASIVAKVTRDAFMTNLSKGKFVVYGWENNKGYGTKMHKTALATHGTTKYHRKTFLKNA